MEFELDYQSTSVKLLSNFLLFQTPLSLSALNHLMWGVDYFQVPYWDENFLSAPLLVELLTLHALTKHASFFNFFPMWDSNLTIDPSRYGVYSFLYGFIPMFIHSWLLDFRINRNINMFFNLNALCKFIVQLFHFCHFSL